jgi:hypothetical protein
VLVAVGRFGFAVVVVVVMCCIVVVVVRRVVDSEVVAVVFAVSILGVDGCLIARGLWRSILLLPYPFDFKLMMDVFRRVRRRWRWWSRGSGS